MDHRRNRVQHPPDPYGNQPPPPGSFVPQDPYYQPQHDQSFQPMGQPFQAGMAYIPADYNVMFQSGKDGYI